MSSTNQGEPYQSVRYVTQPSRPGGWSEMVKIVREFDEEKVKDCKEDIDTLLVFVCYLLNQA
jgi:hypothetical protein